MSTESRAGMPIGSHDAMGAEPLSRRGRVLVIDDDELILRVVRRSLDGHDVVTASDGLRALAVLASSTDFDLLLCDVVMPGMGGLELWAKVAERHPDLLERMVFMTGGARSADEEDFLSSGAVEVLRKPFSFDSLRRLVAQRVEARPRARHG
jgi:CheY-like chemotaxis protein